MPGVPARLIRLRYPAMCSVCGTPLPATTRAWWDGEARTACCEGCGGKPDDSASSPTSTSTAAQAVTGAGSAEGRPAVAGASARREADRRRTKRETEVRSRHPRIGGLILALTAEPRSTTNWATGAEGEEKVGATLDALAPAGVVSLHDRLRPGTTANIDHIAVAPSGVWVIDAKRYKGRVSKKDVGGLMRSDVRLVVGDRDRTALVAAMSKQVAAVHAALGMDWAEVPVRPVLCFVDADWRWFSKPFELQGVLVTWPKALPELLVRPGALQPAAVDPLVARLEDRLRPASAERPSSQLRFRAPVTDPWVPD